MLEVMPTKEMVSFVPEDLREPFVFLQGRILLVADSIAKEDAASRLRNHLTQGQKDELAKISKDAEQQKDLFEKEISAFYSLTDEEQTQVESFYKIYQNNTLRAKKFLRENFKNFSLPLQKYFSEFFVESFSEEESEKKAEPNKKDFQPYHWLNMGQYYFKNKDFPEMAYSLFNKFKEDFPDISKEEQKNIFLEWLSQEKGFSFEQIKTLVLSSEHNTLIDLQKTMEKYQDAAHDFLAKEEDFFSEDASFRKEEKTKKAQSREVLFLLLRKNELSSSLEQIDQIKKYFEIENPKPKEFEEELKKHLLELYEHIDKIEQRYQDLERNLKEITEKLKDRENESFLKKLFRGKERYSGKELMQSRDAIRTEMLDLDFERKKTESEISSINQSLSPKNLRDILTAEQNKVPKDEEILTKIEKALIPDREYFQGQAMEIKKIRSKDKFLQFKKLLALFVYEVDQSNLLNGNLLDIFLTSECTEKNLLKEAKDDKFFLDLENKIKKEISNNLISMDFIKKTLQSMGFYAEINFDDIKARLEKYFHSLDSLQWNSLTMEIYKKALEEITISSGMSKL